MFLRPRNDLWCRRRGRDDLIRRPESPAEIPLVYIECNVPFHPLSRPLSQTSMIIAPQQHCKRTASLAKALDRKSIYEWLATKGYYPETYVLPPCFVVSTHPKYGKRYFPYKARHFSPRITEYQQVPFPKTDYTDRTFGVIDPELHSDIAYTIAKNWKTIVNAIFDKSNKVYSYSFPIPLDSKAPGSIGGLRSGSQRGRCILCLITRNRLDSF